MNVERTASGVQARLLLVVAASLFLAEIFVMALLDLVPRLSPLAEAVLDGALMTLLAFPALYLFMSRPMLRADKEVRLLALRLEEAQRIAHLGNWDWDIVSNGLWWSDEVYRIFGAAPGEFRATYESFLGFVHPEDRAQVDAAVRRALEGAPYSIDHRVVRPDGCVRTVHEQGLVSFAAAGLPVRMAGTVQDVTERVAIEEALREEHSFTNAVLENAGALVLVLDREGRVRRFNRAAEELSGRRFAEVEGRFPWETVLPTEDAETIRKEAFEALAGDSARLAGRYTNHWVSQAGERRLIDWANTLLLDASGRMEFMVSIGVDVTERRRAELALAASVKEKDILLREIQHRVKNNLQLVSSMLALEALRSEDARTREVLESSRERVRAMALIHDMLYRQEPAARIDFAAYLRDLARQVAASHSPAPRIEVEAAGVHLSLTVATPCGLIVSELLTNALKHAFPAGNPGVVRIGFATRGDRHVLSVADDGKGLGRGFDLRGGRLGLQLVQALSSQIAGTLEITDRGGAEFTVTFPAE